MYTSKCKKMNFLYVSISIVFYERKRERERERRTTAPVVDPFRFIVYPS